MVRVEMPSLDLSVQARLLAILFRLVVLLPLLKEPMGCVVVAVGFFGLEPVRGLFRWNAVACLQLLEKFAVGF